VLTKGHGQLKDEAIVRSVRLAGQSGSTKKPLVCQGITLLVGTRLRQQGCHLFRVRGHLAVVRIEDLLEFLSSLLFSLWLALVKVGFTSEEGVEE